MKRVLQGAFVVIFFAGLVGCGEDIEPTEIEPTEIEEPVEIVNAEVPIIDTQPTVIGSAFAYMVEEPAVTLSVDASVSDGGVLSYQWYRSTTENTSSGIALPDETDPSYTPTTEKAVAGDAYYFVRVTNTNTDVNGVNTAIATSALVKITVNAWVASNSWSSWNSAEVVAYDNGIFIAGGSNRLFYSTDGINWTSVENYPFSSASLKAITYGNGRFVAGSSNNRLAYSDNGINWVLVDNFFDALGAPSWADGISSIAYGNNRFVVASHDGQRAYSDDGVNWIITVDPSDPSFEAKYIQSITYGNNRFVAVGIDYTAGGGIEYSDDGIVWSPAQNNSFFDELNYFRSVTYGDNKYIAVGRSGSIAYSDTGEIWTAVTNNPFSTSDDSLIYAIAYGGGRFVAGGGNRVGGDGEESEMAYSDDGINWTAVTDDPTSRFIMSIAYGNNRFIAGGASSLVCCEWP